MLAFFCPKVDFAGINPVFVYFGTAGSEPALDSNSDGWVSLMIEQDQKDEGYAGRNLWRVV
jgi:hypothetical protein